MGCAYFVLIAIVFTISITPAKPIMVSFGTNQGPIVPPPSSTTHRTLPQDIREPAPVNEHVNDIPNPSVYRPPVPLQYRRKFLGYKPNPNLILGTAPDQKYFGSSYKFNLYKKEQARALGLDYRGPQFFEIQPYEIEREQRKALVKSPYANDRNDYWGKNNEVPEIGIVYSSGVKYYVPQVLLDQRQYVDHNQVYDRNDHYY
ncbi:hypothetical protein RN001_008150 [Aquatica leii]|uniref:Uncharacterized protein n=1 Tax=Aquatica leii TaxID=1421715 RepID=A0AAN7SH56_9COLE|nr:hypothetical protein RN001_008150 [Aquatica leii]